MNDFTAWEAVDALCRLGVSLVAIVMLTYFYDDYKADERFGIGVAGGCALMTVPVALEGPAGPFAEWAGALFAFGILVYFVGRVRRKIKHETANKAQHRIARDHLEHKK